MLMKIVEAANAVGISAHELRVGIKAGRYPAIKIGGDGERMRFLVNVELLQRRLEELACANIKEEKPGSVRRVI